MFKKLIIAINDGFSKDKYELIQKIESEFSKFLKKNNPNFFTRFRTNDFYFLFGLYDNYYFSGVLNKYFTIFLDYSNRLTKSAGILRYNPTALQARISFSIPLIFGAYFKETDGYIVNGIFCTNPLEALMRVMEHEITHLIEFILHNNSKCSQPRFIKYAFTLFGHTENKHKLGLEIPKVRKKRQHKFKKGEQVSFVFKNITYKGKISRINKRATVIVNEKKFYVPLELLSYET